jgi:hypothetical protein
MVLPPLSWFVVTCNDLSLFDMDRVAQLEALYKLLFEEQATNLQALQQVYPVESCEGFGQLTTFTSLVLCMLNMTQTAEAKSLPPLCVRAYCSLP